MSKHQFSFSRQISAVLVTVIVVLGSVDARAQCLPVTQIATDLRFPLGITQSNLGDLFVSETGTRELHRGRISIIDRDGNTRHLLDGLPSALNDVNEPSGPAGIFLRGRTLYVVIGIGDNILAGPRPGTGVANPNPSSPILSSILALHLSERAEKITTGFSLTIADHVALANREKLTLSNHGGDNVTVELIAKLPNFTPNPLPAFAANVRGVNPFDVVALHNQLYVTDGAQNLLWRVDIPTGALSRFASFADIPNPLFNPNSPQQSLGGPFVEAVPTGIRTFEDQLLVTLFRGFPFPSGTSVVEQVDPATGVHAPVLTGLNSAIDVLVVTKGGHTAGYVLEHASGPVLSGDGFLKRVPAPGSSPTVIANCLNRPTSMTGDEKNGSLYLTEIVNGRVVKIP